jgi:hypothetical protein
MRPHHGGAVQVDPCRRLAMSSVDSDMVAHVGGEWLCAVRIAQCAYRQLLASRALTFISSSKQYEIQKHMKFSEDRARLTFWLAGFQKNKESSREIKKRGAEVRRHGGARRGRGVSGYLSA